MSRSHNVKGLYNNSEMPLYFKKFIFFIRTLSVLFFIVVYLLSIGLVAVIISYLINYESILYKAGRVAVRIGFNLLDIKIEVDGMEKVNGLKNSIIISNHVSNLDPVALFLIIPFNVRFLAKKELFKIPILSAAMRKGGFIPIDRSNREKAIKSLELAKERLREGAVFVIFPEGTRSASGNLQAFKKGPFILAINSHSSIIPVYIDGSYELMPKGQWYVRSGKIKIKIYDKIETENYAPQDGEVLQMRIYNFYKNIQEAKYARDSIDL